MAPKPAAQVIPVNSIKKMQTEYDDKVADLIEVSLREEKQLFSPIVVRQLGKGYEIWAGHNRYQGAVQAEWAEIEARVYPEDTPDDDMEWISIQENFCRQHFKWQRLAAIWTRWRSRYESRYPQAMHGGARDGAGRPKKSSGTSCNLNSEMPKTADGGGSSPGGLGHSDSGGGGCGPKPLSFLAHAAEATGMSRRAVAQMTTIADNAIAELLEALDDGLISKHDAEKLCRRSDEEQLEEVIRLRKADSDVEDPALEVAAAQKGLRKAISAVHKHGSRLQRLVRAHGADTAEDVETMTAELSATIERIEDVLEALAEEKE